MIRNIAFRFLPLLTLTLLFGCPPIDTDEVDYIELTYEGTTYRNEGVVIDPAPDYKLNYSEDAGTYVHIMLPATVQSGTFTIAGMEWYFNTANLPAAGVFLDADDTNVPFAFVIQRNGSEVGGTFSGEVYDGSAFHAVSGEFFSDEF
jgi:hypothetical protein